MAGLLVSVRDVEEARQAVLGGADLIDVKEPARGSLGRADDRVIAAVIAEVAGRRPVSAALGDLLPGISVDVVPGLAFAKWGLADSAGTPWQERLREAARALPAGCQPVAVAYADALAARAPLPAAVCDFACTQRWPLLIDTFEKTGKSLLDHLDMDELAQLGRCCRAAAIPLALAGSLSQADIARLRPLEPDWFAVRTAACRDGQRTGPICAIQVRKLVQTLQ
jgi:uncharacterized protein (UPF0264 family)